MKKIFLDIDGVIATFKEHWMNATKFQKKNQWAKDLKVTYPFNKECVEILNEIIESTGAEIVLTSDWKKFWTLEQMNVIFKENGIIKPLIDQTKIGFYYSSDDIKIRVAEIETYLKLHNMITSDHNSPIGNWIILDDLPLNWYLPEEIKTRFFLTRDSEGLKQSGLKNKIIEKLNEERE